MNNEQQSVIINLSSFLGRTRSGPTVVRPTQVTEPSLMESVAGLIYRYISEMNYYCIKIEN